MDIQTYQLTNEELVREINKGKELLVEQLEQDGLLKARAQDINEYYALACVQGNGFGNAIKKFLNIKDKGRYVVVCIGERKRPELFMEIPDED